MSKNNKQSNKRTNIRLILRVALVVLVIGILLLGWIKGWIGIDGNGKFYLIGDAIEGQYVANNLHFAAAIAFILMVVLLVCMALMQRYANSRAVA